MNSGSDFLSGFYFYFWQVVAATTVCGDFSNPLLVVPLLPAETAAFPTPLEPVNPDGPQLNADLVGDRYQAYEDSVLQKLKKV